MPGTAGTVKFSGAGRPRWFGLVKGRRKKTAHARTRGSAREVYGDLIDRRWLRGRCGDGVSRIKTFPRERPRSSACFGRASTDGRRRVLREGAHVVPVAVAGVAAAGGRAKACRVTPRSSGSRSSMPAARAVAPRRREPRGRSCDRRSMGMSDAVRAEPRARPWAGGGVGAIGATPSSFLARALLAWRPTLASRP